jgi:hypothetical protein
MALVVNDRVKETSTTTGTGTFDLAGAASGFQTFVAGVGDTNTTYYAIFNQGTTEWEVGLGTVTDAATDTLARTTIISSSNSGSAVDFASGTKDVFCTLPASKAVFGKQEGTNFTDSLLVGHTTTGTLNAANYNTIVGIDAGDAITSSDNNTFVGFNAGTADTTGHSNTFIGSLTGQTNSTTSYNTGVGNGALKFNTAHYNTAVGQLASNRNATGTHNTSIGYNALEGVASNNHSYNTAVGAQSNEACTTGGYNITLGYTAGDNITSGDGNVIIGNVDAASATDDVQLKISGYDGTTTANWISGESTGNVEVAVNWNPSLSTTGKAFVMGF